MFIVQFLVNSDDFFFLPNRHTVTGFTLAYLNTMARLLGLKSRGEGQVVIDRQEGAHKRRNLILQIILQ